MPCADAKIRCTADALAVALMLALGLRAADGALAKIRYKPEHHGTERVSKEPFGDIPKGPLQIFVSINQQKLHLYSDGVHVADTSVATGVPSLPTPLGVFSVIQKQIFHRSNLYSNAPMPFMQRITWSGVALHEGENIGHRASHGCIRMPREFAMRLYGLTRIGARVIVAAANSSPPNSPTRICSCTRTSRPNRRRRQPADARDNCADGRRRQGARPGARRRSGRRARRRPRSACG